MRSLSGCLKISNSDVNFLYWSVSASVRGSAVDASDGGDGRPLEAYTLIHAVWRGMSTCARQILCFWSRPFLSSLRQYRNDSASKYVGRL